MSVIQTGLVERSGQGLNDIFKKTIQDGKGMPSIQDVQDSWVELSIPAQVQDIHFMRYLEEVVNQKQIGLSLEELIALEQLRSKSLPPPAEFRDKFLEYGLIEKIGARGRGMKYVLSHRYYAETRQRGEYTRLVGLSREEKKALLINLKRAVRVTMEGANARK